MLRDKNKSEFLRYVIYFLLIPIGYLNPTLNWIVILFGPFILFTYPNKKISKVQKSYFLGLTVFLIIVLLTGIFSVDPQYPVKNSLNIFSILLASYFISLRLQTISNIALFFKAVLIATLVYTGLLYVFVFDGTTMNFVESETFGKNSSSLIIFVGLISSLLVSFLLERKQLLNIINIFFYVTIFLTGSIKIIIVSTLLLLYYYFFREGFKLKTIISAIIIVFIFSFLSEQYIRFAGLENEQSFLRITSRLSVLFGGESDISYIDTDYMIEGRAYLIDKGLDLFYENPLFGIGLENTRYYLGTYTHNNFVEILAGTGIIGFLVYIYTLFPLLIACFKIPDYKIRIILLFSFLCFILISNAQRIYDNRYLMVFLVSYLAIYKVMKNGKSE